MDRLKAMHTFVQIADHGSLTKAAEVLDTSLPAVVRSLAALEAHLGVRLFHRTTRRISLTEEGRHYLDSAREVLSAADAADRALTAEAAEPVGQLTITAPVLFGHMYVAPAVVRFLQRHDKLRCSVMLHDRPVNLLEEGIDVGIRISPLDDSSLVAQQLGSIRRVVVASPDYLRRHGTPSHPRDLARAGADVNWVRIHPAGPVQFREHGNAHGRAHGRAYGGEHRGEHGRSFGIVAKGNLEFNHIAPAVEACAAGMGFGVFFSYQVQSFVAAGRLKIVLEDFEPPPRPVSVIYPHARLLPARTRAFIDWIKNEFQSLHF